MTAPSPLPVVALGSCRARTVLWSTGHTSRVTIAVKSTFSLQNDGDLLYGPGVLWTAAHHKIPVLFVMNNNRAYHEEVMHLQRMANRRERGIDRAHIGTAIDDPAIDFTKVAQGMGVHAEGPITDPKDLAPAIRRAIATVKNGEPALVDVVTLPR